MSELDTIRCTIEEIDRDIAQLFEKRMDAVGLVAEYKLQNGLPIEDADREQALLQKNVAYIQNPCYEPLYAQFQRDMMRLSKEYQHQMSNEFIFVHTRAGGYPVMLRRGFLQHAGEFFNLNRKVLIVTDSGVPEQYGMTVASQCKDAVVFVFEQGEKSKCLETYAQILQVLTENAFTRTDCVVAVGGGVVGDVAGFAAASYMRGIDFYNIPTTLLAQVDSSVGGKTAVNFEGYKNLIGAFYQPKGVLIDPDVLHTLPVRHVRNGLVETLKMSLTHDANLFDLFEQQELTDSVLEEVIRRAITVKKSVVEADEYESDQRKSLNFGHTWGHAIERCTGLLHGECVAEGMIPMCSSEVRLRLIPVLEKLELYPLSKSIPKFNLVDALNACNLDKKASDDRIMVVTVPQIGCYELKKMPLDEYKQLIMRWYR